MRKYETIVVFNAELPTEQIQAETARIEAALRTNQAESLKVEVWGRKDMTFRRKGQKHGHYVLYSYESKNHALVETITGLLRIADSILLFQTHGVSDRQRKFKGRVREGSQVDSGSDDFIEGF